MANEKNPKLKNKELSNTSEETVEKTTKNNLTENLDVDKEKIRRQRYSSCI